MKRTLAPTWLLLPLAIAATPARADPGYYVVTAYDNQGVRTVDFRYWTVKFPQQPAVIWPEIGFGYGVTSRWYTELFASYIGSREMATRLETLNWQNEVLLTQGEYPFDLAVHLQVIRQHDRAAGDAVEFGPVFQTDIGRNQINANLFFERRIGADAAVPTTLKYQWQVKHRWSPAWQWGLQGFGEIQPWDDWPPRAEQSHRAGPVLFGRLPLRDGSSLLYQAAYLFGSVYGMHAEMFSMRVQYAF